MKFVTIGRLIGTAMKEDLDKSSRSPGDDAECTDAIISNLPSENRMRIVLIG